MAPRITQISGFSTRRAGTGVVFDVLGEEARNPAGRQDNWPLTWELEDKTYGPHSPLEGTQKAYEVFKFTFHPQESEEEAVSILTYLISRVDNFHFQRAGIDRESLQLATDIPALFEIMDRLGYAMQQRRGQKFLASFNLYIRVEIDETPDP